jgi:hypothetical protein
MKISPFSRLKYLVAALLLTAAMPLGVACSSDDDSGTSGGGTSGGGTSGGGTSGGGTSGGGEQGVRKMISASAGGTVSDASGTVTLEIPAGALAQDTEITLAVLEPESGAQSKVYDFGPAGTQFLKPASLSIKFNGSVPTDKKAVVAWLDGSTWKPLNNVTAGDGAIKGDVEHFTKFAIVFVDGKVVANACADVVKNFSACGGDPKGTWKYRDVCMTVPMGSGSNPFLQQCPDAKFEGEVTMDGTVTITETEVQESATKMTMVSVSRIPSSCYQFLQASSCAEVRQRLAGASSTEENGVCVVKSAPQTQQEAAETKTYTLEGNTIKTSGSAKGAAYCVKGTSMELEAVDRESGERRGVLVLEKQ